MGWAEIADRVLVACRDDGTVPISTYTKLTDSTIAVVTPLKTFVLRNAAQVEDIDLNQADGKYTLAFEGPGPIREF